VQDVSTAFTDSGAPATLAAAPHRPLLGALLDRHPALAGLFIGLVLLATSVLLALLLTSALFGYPSGGLT
jgi:hypothetical protein